MNAFVLYGPDNIRFEEVKIPSPKKGEVLVKVKAVGICGSDIPRIYHTGAHKHPLIPGHEFSGIVTEVGEGVRKEWLNQNVGVFPLIPCGKCRCCQNKQYEMCDNYDYLGSRSDGGFAEYVVVPEWNLIGLPENISYEAAAMLEPMAVCVHAIRKGMPQKDDVVVVCGLGTIGQLLTMFLMEMGIEKILVVGNKEFQKEIAIQQGIPEEDYCNSKIEDVEHWIMEKTAGNGANVFFECVGKNETLVYGLRCAAPMAKIVTVGNPYSDVFLDKNDYWRILRKQLQIVGTWNSSFIHDENDDWHYVLNKLADGTIRPDKLISHRYSLNELECGMHIMRDKSEEFIKIMAID